MISFAEQLQELHEFDDRHRWLLDVDLTYCSGRFLLVRDDFFFRLSGGYLIHQASEKYLKTLRKVVVPDIIMRKGGHNLEKILDDLKDKIESSLYKKITESIERIEPLAEFRYPDLTGTRDKETMQQGLEGADCLVPSVRNKIDNYSPIIAFKGIRRYISGSKNNDQILLIDSLLRNNLNAKYWIKHLSGINTKIDHRLRKYQPI
jgi:hypothetical protein